MVNLNVESENKFERLLLLKKSDLSRIDSELNTLVMFSPEYETAFEAYSKVAYDIMDIENELLMLNMNS